MLSDLCPVLAGCRVIGSSVSERHLAHHNRPPVLVTCELGKRSHKCLRGSVR